MSERISHNALIKDELEDAGFDVRWNMNDGLIVSLTRHIPTVSEVKTALCNAGYEEGMFTACGNGRLVIVDAVC